MVKGGRGRHKYLVIDGELQKRSRYYIFRDWAETRDGQWIPLPVDSESGRWVIPRGSRTAFKNYADHAFGGQTWLDVLSQMGGCPCEFVDCWNQTIDQRLQATISPRLVCHDGASTPSS